MYKSYSSSDIAQNIRVIAKSKKIQLKQMFHDLGLTESTLTNFKTSMPKIDTLTKIANYLDVSIDYLLDRDVSSKTVDKSFKSNIQGDNNGNVGYNINKADELQIDGLSKEMISEFEQLGYSDKVKVMSLIAELREKKGA